MTILIAGSGLGLFVPLIVHLVNRRRGASPPIDRSLRHEWHMPPVEELAPLLDRIWMGVLRAYLVLAAGLVLVRIASLALSPQTQ